MRSEDTQLRGRVRPRRHSLWTPCGPNCGPPRRRRPHRRVRSPPRGRYPSTSSPSGPAREDAFAARQRRHHQSCRLRRRRRRRRCCRCNWGRSSPSSPHPPRPAPPCHRPPRRRIPTTRTWTTTRTLPSTTVPCRAGLLLRRSRTPRPYQRRRRGGTSLLRASRRRPARAH